MLSSLADTGGSDFSSGVSGLLWVHLLAGRGLRSTTSSSAATTPSTPSGQPSLGKKKLILHLNNNKKLYSINNFI